MSHIWRNHVTQAAYWKPDESKFGPGPYPTIVPVYGGPHVQTVSNSWTLTADLRSQVHIRLRHENERERERERERETETEREGKRWLFGMCYVTHMNELCHTHENESCHINEWVVTLTTDLRLQVHVRMLSWLTFQVSRSNESCHTYGWVTAHIREWVMLHRWMNYVTHMNESWPCLLTSALRCHMRDMNRLYVWRDSSVYVSRRICMRDTANCRYGGTESGDFF